jgi:hypothetical protein
MLGGNPTPANSDTVDFSMKALVPRTAIIAHGSHKHTPPRETFLGDFDGELRTRPGPENS